MSTSICGVIFGSTIFMNRDLAVNWFNWSIIQLSVAKKCGCRDSSKRQQEEKI